MVKSGEEKLGAVCNLFDKGISTDAIARRLDINPAVVREMVRDYIEWKDAPVLFSDSNGF